MLFAKATGSLSIVKTCQDGQIVGGLNGRAIVQVQLIAVKGGTRDAFLAWWVGGEGQILGCPVRSPEEKHALPMH